MNVWETTTIVIKMLLVLIIQMGLFSVLAIMDITEAAQLVKVIAHFFQCYSTFLVLQTI